MASDSTSGPVGRKAALGMAIAFVLVALAVAGIIRSRSTIPRGTITVLAVLPLEGAAADTTTAYLVTEIPGELIDRLSGIAPDRMRVIARWSALHAPRDDRTVGAIATELGATHVLGGTVDTAGDHPVIEFAMRPVDGGAALWTARYDAPPDELFDLTKDVVRRVARALSVDLPPPNPSLEPMSPLAFVHLIRARYLLSRGDTLSAREGARFLERGLGSDWGYAPIHIGIAEASLREGRARDASMALTRALGIDPNLARGLYMRGTLRFAQQWDWQGAIDDYERALAIWPGMSDAHLAYAWLLTILGLHEESQSHALRALETDPLNPDVLIDGGRIAIYGGRYDKATELCSAAIALIGADDAAARCMLYSAIAAGEEEAAADAVLDLAGEGAVSDGAERGERSAPDVIAEYWTDALRDAEHRTSQGYAESYSEALALAQLGRAADAMRALERAEGEGDALLVTVAVDPLLAAVRAEPGFVELLERMELPN